MSAPEPISPRGIPPIRPDWLIDVAWRLADAGLAALRAWPEDAVLELEDLVDGEPWRFVSGRLSPWESTVVEHEADLYLPTDAPDSPTLRAGFALLPWWDELHGASVHLRVEVGPRGPVTFDPENWVAVVPVSGAGRRPPVAGLEPGTWRLPSAPPEPAVELTDVLIGQALSFRDLALLITGDRPLPELLLASRPYVERRRLLGGTRRQLAEEPTHFAWVVAEGPIEAHWTGATTLGAMIPQGFAHVEQVEFGMARCTFRGAEGALTLSGPALELHAMIPRS